MHTIQIPGEKNIHEVPSCIEEMNESQFITFVDLLLKFRQDLITIEQFKICLIIKLADIRYTVNYFLLSNERKEAVNDGLFRLSNLVDSFFIEEIREDRPVLVLQLNFIKQIIPRIAGKYYGPIDGLHDCTFCEYRLAYGFYKSYLNTQQDYDLNHMIAVLYRPKRKFLWIRKRLPGFDGQSRTLFTAKSNPRFLEARAKQIGKLPMAMRYGIFLFFAGCNEYLATGEVEIEGNKIDLSLLYKRSSSDSPDSGVGLIGLLYSLAETKVFGSIDDTDNQNIYDIMIRLYQVMKQYEAMKPK
jgi:hypothetical protein